MAQTQTPVERIAPRQAREHLDADPNTLLVCAYDSQDKFEQNHLEGAIPLGEFQSRAESLPRDTEIIFYCA